MSKNTIMSSKQMEMAQRLVASAEIQTVRLTAARVLTETSRSSKAPTATSNLPGMGISVDAFHEGHGILKPDRRLQAVVDFTVNARQGTGKNARTVFKISASFHLVYELPSELKPDRSEILAFAQTNAVYNAWPYWREFVQSMTSRMNVPPLTLPLLRIGTIDRKISKSSG